MITIPTISQLYTAIKNDIEVEYGDTIPVFGKNFLRALAMVQAGKLRIYYLAIAKLQKNIFIDTADPEASGGTLERFGRIKLNRNPFPARAAQYDVTVTGDIGSIIPAKTTFKSNDDSLNPGKLYILDIEHEMITTSDEITLRALEPGVDSRLDVSDTLTVTAPIDNVDRVVTVEDESVEPRAAETIEDYRAKGLDSYRTEPQGGAAADYRQWAADAQGVERVYPYARSGNAGEINLYVEATTADSTDGKGTPSAGLLSDVQDVVEFDPDTTKPLNERGRQPLTVLEVHYLPVTPLNVNIDIADFNGVTAGIETLIFNALKEKIDRIRPFVSAADILSNKNDILDVNKIIATILETRPGSIFGTVTLTVNSIVESSHQFTEGDIPFLNAVNFT